MAALIDHLEQFPLQMLRLDAQSFSYRSAGNPDKPALVLLHGIGSGSGSWVQQFQALSDAFYLVAWDAPGYGQSTPLASAKPLAADYAQALQCFMAALNIPQAYVLGHSLGALMAASFAKAHPEQVLGLILANAAQGYGAADVQVREVKLRERLTQMQALGPQGLAEQRAANLLSPQASAEHLALVQYNMRRLVPAGYAQASELLAQGRLLADASPALKRVLVIAGSADTITPAEGVQQVAQAFKTERFEIINAGHASYIEAPQAFNQILSQFLKGAV